MDRLIKRINVIQESMGDTVTRAEILKNGYKMVQMGFFIGLWGGEWDDLLHMTPVKEEGEWSPATSGCNDVQVDTSKQEFNSSTNTEAMTQDMLQAGRLPDWIAESEEGCLDHVSPHTWIWTIGEEGHSRGAIPINNVTMVEKGLHRTDQVIWAGSENDLRTFLTHGFHPRDVKSGWSSPIAHGSKVYRW